MSYEELESLLLAKPGAHLDFPFGPQAAVFKVFKKMFALVAIEEDPLHITLKCHPEEAIALRSMFDAIGPAYHMNKEHWNTVILDGSLPGDLARQLIDHSYDQVVSRLTKVEQQQLNSLF